MQHALRHLSIVARFRALLSVQAAVQVVQRRLRRQENKERPLAVARSASSAFLIRYACSYSVSVALGRPRSLRDRSPVSQGRRGRPCHPSATGPRGDEECCSWQSSSARQKHDASSQRHEQSGSQVQQLPTQLKMKWPGSSLQSRLSVHLRELDFAGLSLEGAVGNNSTGTCQ